MGKILAYVMGAVAIIAIIAGLYLTGGPREARREAFDEEQMENLAKISEALHCFGDLDTDKALPDTLTVETLRQYCSHVDISQADLRDVDTGVPYAYTRISEIEYSVCAEFNDAQKAFEQNDHIFFEQHSTFYPEEGCVKGVVR